MNVFFRWKKWAASNFETISGTGLAEHSSGFLNLKHFLR